MRRRKVGAAWLAALLLACGACGRADGTVEPAGPTEFAADTTAPGLHHAQVDSVYEVSGSTAVELGASMAARGPSGDGTPYFGSTLWALRWRWRPELTGFGCRLADPTVRLEITMTLPEWEAPPDAPAALVDRWHAFLPALRRHELGHRDLAIAMAQETLIVLDGISAASCERAGELAERAATRVRERWNARQDAYERDLHNTPPAARWPER